MGQVYSKPDGTQVYDNNGQTINAKTGAVYAPATAAPDAGTSAPTSSGSTDDFIQTLKDKLLSQSGAISSSDSNIESSINAAIQGVTDSNNASKTGINADYDRQISDQNDTNKNTVTSYQDAQRGYATNNAAFQQLVTYNQKTINDLESRRQSALATGDAATASKIADLQLQKLTFENQAAQQTFSNLLSLAGFALQDKAATTQESQFNQTQAFNTSTAVSNIALKYGLTVGPNETLASITAKAAPFASTEEKQQMALATAQINQANAEAAKALSDAAMNKPLSDASIAGLAQAYASGNTGILANVKDPVTQQAIINQASTLEATNSVNQLKLAGISKANAQNQILSSSATATAKAAQIAVLDKVYTADTTSSSSNSNPLGSLFDWISVKTGLLSQDQVTYTNLVNKKLGGGTLTAAENAQVASLYAKGAR